MQLVAAPSPALIAWFETRQPSAVSTWIREYAAGAASLRQIAEAEAGVSEHLLEWLLAGQGLSLTEDDEHRLNRSRRRDWVNAFDGDALRLAGAHLSNELIPDVLRALLRIDGRTQETLAAASGVPVRSIESYVSAKPVSPRVSTLARLLGTLNCGLRVEPGPVPLPAAHSGTDESWAPLVSSLPGESGTLIRQLRERAGLSQEALASVAGLSRSAIAKIERGDRYVSRRDEQPRSAEPTYSTFERVILHMPLPARRSRPGTVGRPGPGRPVGRRLSLVEGLAA